MANKSKKDNERKGLIDIALSHAVPLGILIGVGSAILSTAIYKGEKFFSDYHNKPAITQDINEREMQEQKSLQSSLEMLAEAEKNENVEQPASVAQEGYAYLDVYNDSIKKYLTKFNDQLKPNEPLDIKTVKAMIAIESGSKEFRETAFVYDPLQFANKGDFGLKVLANGLEGSYLIGDFRELRDKKPTPRKNGRWDYSNTNLDTESSLRGGIGFLFHKAATYGPVTRESGNVLEYTVSPRDNYAKISKKVSTTIDALEKYNPGVNPKRLQIGQKLKFRRAETKLEIIGWKDWDEAVRNYNGGGNPHYLEEVNEIKKRLN